MSCSSPRFYKRLGHIIDPELLRSEPGKRAMHAAHAINNELGHGPSSSLIVIQRLRRWLNDGKVSHEQIEEVSDLFDLAEDLGMPDEDSVIAEFVPVIQQRMRDDAIEAAVASYGKHGDLSAMTALLEKADRVGKEPSVTTRNGFQLVQLDTVQRVSVQWLWRGRIPLGKLTTIDGDPGRGKSTVVADLAARVTTGSPMPGANVARLPANVIVLSAEDGAADTIRPRIELAGGDASRVHVLGEGSVASFSRNLDALAAAMEKLRPDLVVIDPIMAFLGASVDAHRDQDVRIVMTPLSALAQQHGAATVLVRHLNKTASAKALYRGGGSIGLIGAARSGLLVVNDPDDDSARILVSMKSNLGPMPRGYRFRVVTCAEPDGDAPFEGSGIEWIEECDASPDELLVPVERETEEDRARAFLRRVLEAEGELPSVELVVHAEQEGISLRTLERAKKGIVTSSKVGKVWMCRLLGPRPEDRQPPPPKDDGGLGGDDEDAGNDAAASEEA